MALIARQTCEADAVAGASHKSVRLGAVMVEVEAGGEQVDCRCGEKAEGIVG